MYITYDHVNRSVIIGPNVISQFINYKNEVLIDISGCY